MTAGTIDLQTIIRTGIELLDIHEMYNQSADNAGLTAQLLLMAREAGLTGPDVDDGAASSIDAIGQFEVFALGIAYAFRYERSAWEMLDTMGARLSREAICDRLRERLLRAL